MKRLARRAQKRRKLANCLKLTKTPARACANAELQSPNKNTEKKSLIERNMKQKLTNLKRHNNSNKQTKNCKKKIKEVIKKLKWSLKCAGEGNLYNQYQISYINKDKKNRFLRDYMKERKQKLLSPLLWSTPPPFPGVCLRVCVRMKRKSLKWIILGHVFFFPNFVILIVGPTTTQKKGKNTTFCFSLLYRKK